MGQRRRFRRSFGVESEIVRHTPDVRTSRVYLFREHAPGVGVIGGKITRIGFPFLYSRINIIIYIYIYIYVYTRMRWYASDYIIIYIIQRPQVVTIYDMRIHRVKRTFYVMCVTRRPVQSR